MSNEGCVLRCNPEKNPSVFQLKTAVNHFLINIYHVDKYLSTTRSTVWGRTAMLRRSGVVYKNSTACSFTSSTGLDFFLPPSQNVVLVFQSTCIAFAFSSFYSRLPQTTTTVPYASIPATLARRWDVRHCRANSAAGLRLVAAAGSNTPSSRCPAWSGVAGRLPACEVLPRLEAS